MAISVNSIAQDDSSPFALYTLRGKAVAKTKLFPRVSQRLKSTVTRHILNNERHPRFSKSGYFNKRSNRNAENRHQTRVSATLCNNYTVCSPSLIVSAKNNTYRTVMMQGKFVLFITGLCTFFLNVEGALKRCKKNDKLSAFAKSIGAADEEMKTEQHFGTKTIGQRG